VLDTFVEDRLRLIFACCHPALAMENRIASTLHTVLGLSVAETAQFLLMSEQIMRKRLVRTRAKVGNAGKPYCVPPPHLLPERLPEVLAVLYLLFTQRYSSGGVTPDLIWPARAGEAPRLTVGACPPALRVSFQPTRPTDPRCAQPVRRPGSNRLVASACGTTAQRAFRTLRGGTPGRRTGLPRGVPR
jgi:hypothetical protein